jgi:hypothetical protein
MRILKPQLIKIQLSRTNPSPPLQFNPSTTKNSRQNSPASKMDQLNHTFIKSLKQIERDSLMKIEKNEPWVTRAILKDERKLILDK